MPLIEMSQYKTLSAHCENLGELEAVIRSAAPERWSVAFRIAKLREKAQAQAPISTEELVNALAGLARECRQLGPNSQEVVQTQLVPLIERLGLSEQVYQAAEAPRDLAGAGAEDSEAWQVALAI